MRDAPAVSYPVGRSSFQAGIALTLWLLGALACASWLAPMPHASWRLPLALAVWSGAGLFAALSWQRSILGLLRWTGEAWQLLLPQSVVGTLLLHVDLQFGMLVEFRPLEDQALAGSQWFWLARRSDPTQWHLMRVAICSGQAKRGAPVPGTSKIAAAPRGSSA